MPATTATLSPPPAGRAIVLPKTARTFDPAPPLPSYAKDPDLNLAAKALRKAYAGELSADLLARVRHDLPEYLSAYLADLNHRTRRDAVLKRFFEWEVQLYRNRDGELVIVELQGWREPAP